MIMMLCQCWVVILAVLSVSDIGGTSAFPSGAGFCGPGLAVGGAHLDDPIRTLLEEELISVAVGGTPLTQNTTLLVEVGSMDLTVVAANRPIRGILIRAERPDLLPLELTSANDTILTPAAVCLEPAVGLTHRTRDDKSELVSVLAIDTPGTVSLQITVVLYAGRYEQSSHAYTEFMLQASSPQPKAAAALSSEPPVEPPTQPPTKAPSKVPTKTPTKAPFATIEASVSKGEKKKEKKATGVR